MPETSEPLVSGLRFERLPPEDSDGSSPPVRSGYPRTAAGCRTCWWVVRYAFSWLLTIWSFSSVSVPLNFELCGVYSGMLVGQQITQQELLLQSLASDVLGLGCYAHFNGGEMEEEVQEARQQAVEEFRAGFLPVASKRLNCLSAEILPIPYWISFTWTATGTTRT